VEEKDVRVRPLRVSKRGIAAVVVLFAVTLLAAQTCQQSQVRVSQDRAVATARERAGFVPERTQIRLVRQGLNGHPYWAISLSIPKHGNEGFERVSVARVDANTGKLVAFTDNASQEGAP
jgi:hypothetical protein